MNVFALSKVIKGKKKASAQITIYIPCLYFILLDSWWQEFCGFNIFHHCFCYFLNHLEVEQLCVVIKMHAKALPYHTLSKQLFYHSLSFRMFRIAQLILCYFFCLTFLFQTKYSINNANKILIILSPWLCACECKKAHSLLFLLCTHSRSAWKKLFWGISPRHSVK